MEDIQIVQVKPGDSLHTQCLHLRHEVLRVPIGRSLFTEDLSKEVNDVFLVAVAPTSTSTTTLESQNGKVIGCIILTIYSGDPVTNKIRQMAVSSDYQGKGIGSLLVRRAEMFAKADGKNRLYLHGRKHAVGFYLKMGYKIVSEEFLELEIPHFAMEKML